MGQLGARVGKLAGELEEERRLNQSLWENQGEWQRWAEVELAVLKETKDTEIQELKDQVRDLMFFMEVQCPVKMSPLKDKIASGSVVVGEAPPPPCPGGGGGAGGAAGQA